MRRQTPTKKELHIDNCVLHRIFVAWGAGGGESFLVFLAEASYRKYFLSGVLQNFLQLQFHDLMVFDC